MRDLLRQQDVLGGLLLIAFGALGLMLGADLDPGTARRMGPGFFPRILSWLLLLLGGIVVAGGVRTRGEAVTPVVWRALVCIMAAVVAFWLAIDRAGLVAATIAVIVLGGLGGRNPRPLEIVLLAVSMAVATALLFVYALNLPLPLWGR
jgi:hypothetical protein